MSENVDEILKEVLNEIKPKENHKDLIEKSVKIIKKNLEKSNVDAEVFVGGSYAKGTFIGDSFDCDIFIRCKDDLENLSDAVEPIVKDTAKELNSEYFRIKASRDYFQIVIGKITLEIVPVKYIEDISDADNIMDFSPFHVGWAVKEITKKDCADDIRLMKMFLKAGNIYGAESHIQGFSGHVADILILYYGGFIDALKAMSKWNINEKVIIDYGRAYKGQDVSFFMNNSKINSALIVVDPIDKERNAAAALHQKNLEKGVERAKAFLAKPSLEFFEKKRLDAKEIKNEFPDSCVVEIIAEPHKGKRDIVGSKIIKAKEFIERRLQEEGFEVKKALWQWEEKAQIFLVLEQDKIPETFLQKGPRKDMKEAVSAFRKKNDKIIEKEDVLFAEKERNFTDIRVALDTIVKEDYLKEKLKKVEYMQVQSIL